MLYSRGFRCSPMGLKSDYLEVNEISLLELGTPSSLFITARDSYFRRVVVQSSRLHSNAPFGLFGLDC